MNQSKFYEQDRRDRDSYIKDAKHVIAIDELVKSIEPLSKNICVICGDTYYSEKLESCCGDCS